MKNESHIFHGSLKFKFIEMSTKLLPLISLVFNLSFSVSAQETNTNNRAIAIEGYDPVSYFDGKPMIGKVQYTYTIEKVTYQFSSQENKTIFSQNPDKYIPQYGGWCAYAMAVSGDQVSIDPATYRVTDDKLYLFYNKRGYDTSVPWRTSESDFIKKANDNWVSKIQSN